MTEGVGIKLISDRVLLDKAVGNSYKTSPFCVNQEDKCIYAQKSSKVQFKLEQCIFRFVHL